MLSVWTILRIAMLQDRMLLETSVVLNKTARTPRVVIRETCPAFIHGERSETMLLVMLVEFLMIEGANNLPGRPQPIPTMR